MVLLRKTIRKVHVVGLAKNLRLENDEKISFYFLTRCKNFLILNMTLRTFFHSKSEALKFFISEANALYFL